MFLCSRGNDFRLDYGKLGVLCALFSDIPCLAMTATANQKDIKVIQDSLGLKNCVSIVANPDRKNIFYEKILRRGQDIDLIQTNLMPIAKSLLEEKTGYPLTVIYITLRLCGFAYRFFESILGSAQ